MKRDDISLNIDELNWLAPTRNYENKWADISLKCAMYSPLAVVFGFLPPIQLLIILLPIGALAGVISAIIAFVLICLPHSRYTGARKALAGLIACTILFVIPGLFYASFRNYAEGAGNWRSPKELAMAVMMYAVDHQGIIPSSLDVLGLAEEKMSAKYYRFYFFYTKHPYLLNAHLAGKDIYTIADSERTVLIAEGRKMGEKTFDGIEDLGFNPVCAMAFVDGHATSIQSDKIDSYFPPNGVDTKGSFRIEPKYVSKGEDSVK